MDEKTLEKLYPEKSELSTLSFQEQLEFITFNSKNIKEKLKDNNKLLIQIPLNEIAKDNYIISLFCNLFCLSFIKPFPNDLVVNFIGKKREHIIFFYNFFTKHETLQKKYQGLLNDINKNYEPFKLSERGANNKKIAPCEIIHYLNFEIEIKKFDFKRKERDIEEIFKDINVSELNKKNLKELFHILTEIFKSNQVENERHKLKSTLLSRLVENITTFEGILHIFFFQRLFEAQFSEIKPKLNAKYISILNQTTLNQIDKSIVKKVNEHFIKNKIIDKEEMFFTGLINKEQMLKTMIIFSYFLDSFPEDVISDIIIKLCKNQSRIYDSDLLMQLEKDPAITKVIENLFPINEDNFIIQGENFSEVIKEEKKISLYKHLNDLGLFTDNFNQFQKTSFCIKIKKIFLRLKQSIKWLDITHSDLIKLQKLDTDKLNNIIEVICFNNEDEITEIKEKLNLYMEIFNDLETKLNETIKFNNFYLPNKHSELNGLKKNWFENKLNLIPIDKINEIIQNSDKALKYNKYTKSYVFKYKTEEERKDKTNDTYIKNTISKFINEYKSIFQWNDTFEIMRTKLNNLTHIFSKFNDESKYEDEIKLLSSDLFFNIKEYNIDTVKDHFITLKKISALQMHLSNLKKFIDFFTNELNIKKNKEFDENLQGLSKIPGTIQGMKNIINNFNEDFTKKNAEIFQLLIEHKGLIEFLCEHSNKSKNLLELMDDNEEGQRKELQVNDVVDFIDVLHFINEIKNIPDEYKSSNLDSKKLFEAIEKILQNKQKETFIRKIKNVSLNISLFNDLIKNVDKIGQSKATAQKLRTNSSYSTSFDSNKGYQWNISYNTSTNETNNITLENFYDIGETLSFAKQKDKDKEKDKEDEIGQFCTFVNSIKSISEILQKLFMQGEKTKKIKFYINQEPMNKINSYIETKIEELEKKSKKIAHAQKEFYKKNPLCFIFGKQFPLVYEFIYESQQKNKQNNVKEITHLFNYLTNWNFREYPRIKNTDDYPSIEIINWDDLLKKIKTYLNELYSLNNNNGHSFFSDNLIADTFKLNEKLGTLKTSEETIEIDIIKLYVKLTQNLPLPQMVLICNEYTTNEEIICFLHKARFCGEALLFYICNIEILSIEQTKLIVKFLNTNYTSKNVNEIKSLLVFGYTNTKSSIINQIHRYHSHLFKLIQVEKGVLEESLQNMIQTNLKVEIIKANESGQGKSFKIQSISKNTSSKYIYFPLGGNLNQQFLINRLIDCDFPTNSKDKQIIFHLDLTDHHEIPEGKSMILKHFLFSILYFKVYSFKEKIVVLPKNIQIYIEIPNGFVKFPYQFLKFKETTIQSKEKMDYPYHRKSHIHVLMNYLKCYRQVENKTRAIQNLDLCFYKDESEIDRLKYKANDIHKGPDKPPKGKIIKYDEGLTYLEEEFTLNDEKKKLISPDTMNFYQITSIIKIMAENLNIFTDNIHMTANMDSKLKKLRPYFIENLVFLTHYLLNPDTYKELKEQQEMALKNEIENNDNNKKKKKAKEREYKGQLITFDDIKSSIIFINDDKQSLTIIPKSKSNEEYKILENFMSLSNEKLEHITDLDSKKFLFKVKRLLDIKDNDLSGTTQMPYVFTADNYIKVIYIILRLRARIPIIMVGETGCGKTSLIKILAEIKKINMKVYNVHAETTEEEIANFFINDNELKPLEKNEVDNSENLSEKWVFFDEINTCNSLGLISEIMCKYSLHGKKLKSNLRFFAACNPFKLSKVQRTEGIEMIDNNNNIKKKNEKKLVYLVHPLPNSLLNFVFYCGQLKPEDERKYIERILLSQFEDKHKYKFDNFNIDCIDLCTQLISKSQIFLREKGLDSSVSLRDIRRFSVFYKWFIYMLTIKSSFSTLPYEKHEIYLRSIVLSLYICYYIRLIDKGHRSNYIDEIFKGYEIDFNKIITEEQEDLASFILDDSTNNEGIAKNKPLLENIFCIFACINTKIPLILCGKPGCSKTLSVSKVYDALKGENSKKPFLRKFPNIYMKSYQGSMKSTSEGISKTFESARAAIRTSNDKSNNKEYQQQLTPLVFFDELGLAERAPGNPLKVLHYELEYDEDIGLSSNYKEKVAFVGVSNWSLDNAKMNRMVFLSIPELDDIDLKKTAQNIAKSYSEQISTLYENEFGDLGMIFSSFKTKINHIGEGNLFGLRDFYYFIKHVVIQLTQKQNENSKTKAINDNEFHEIVFKGLERNFSGFPNSFELICDEYKQLKKINIQHIPTIGIKQCLLNNLNETKSRFLMLISKPYIGHYLFQDIITESHNNNNNNNNNKEIQIFIGSKFPQDLQTDKYLLKQCNRIQLSLDKDNSIICLENHDRIYPSFYELFNKNYFSMGNKQYSKISYGYKKISLSEVNPNFRCAVFVDSDKVRSLEPPLLNRFEKQIISYKDILTSQENKYAEDIFDILRKIPYDINKDGNVTNKVTFIQLKTQLINCSLNEYKEGVALSELPIENIRGLVYHAVRHSNINTYEEIEQYVLAKIVNIFSQDIMSFISYSGFKERYERMYKKIKNIYEDKEKKFPNLKMYMDNVPSMKSIIYTFSNILDNNHINMLKQNSQLKYIANYKSEDDLENDIDKFFNSKPQSSDKKSYFVLYIKQYEIEYLFHINSVIDNVISKQEKQNIENKYIIFIVFLTRQLNDKNEEKPKEELYISSIPFIDESIHQIFIDNLNKNQNTNPPINNNNNTTTPDLSKIFETIINDSSITIQRKLKYYNNDNKSLIQTIQEIISSNTFIKNEIINIVKQNVYSPSFIYNILFYEKGDFLHLIDFISIEEYQKSNAIERQLGNFIIQLLKDNALAMMTKSAPTSINNVWKKYLSSLTPANYMKSYEVNIDLMGELQVPSSFAAIKRILPEMHNQINQYLLYQNQCRREGKAVESMKYLKICESYRNKKKSIIAQAIDVVRKDNVIKLIEQEKLLNKLLKDYFICLIYYDQKLIVDSGVISIFQILEKYINITDAKIDKNKDNECVYNIEQFVEIVMWFECNITLVRLIVQIYNTLSNKDFKKIFEETIVNNNNDYYSSLVVSDIVNAPFIKIFNSLSSFFSKHIKDVVKEEELLPILNLINRTNIIAKQLYLIELSDLDFYIVLSDIMHKRNKAINMSVFRKAVENRKMSSVKQIEYIINNLNDIDKFKRELFQGFFRWSNDSKDKKELLNFYLNYDNNSN